MIIQKPRGTYDIYDKEYNLFEKINETFNIVSKVYNFKPIVTPIFELKDLFVRNIGSTTDIVTKEFYDFIDKGGREMALRPEGTVSVIRSVVENKLYATNPLPLKLSYFGPMFRYERPQSGRNRQFWQLGAEFIGIKTIEDQIEAILMCRTLLSSLGIEKWELNINYIGGNESRKKWIDSLKSYFSKYINELSDDSKSRINKNPLRILDDKVDGEKDFVKNAVKISEFLTDFEKEEWKLLQENLNSLKINYVLNDKLVRGLDYYNGFVFEFVSVSDKLKGQSTLIGGGKYSGLVSELNGPELDCIGFAAGIERLSIALDDEQKNIVFPTLDVYLAFVGNENKNFLMLISNVLRASGISCEINYEIQKLDKHFKNASKFNPKLILIFGNKEKETETIIIKNQKTLKEKRVKVNNLLKELKKQLKGF